MAGYFVTFEGGEGSGKSTQIARLAAHLRASGRKVLITREPGGSKGAEAVRHIILSGLAEDLGADWEAVLFAAARADHVAELIQPALAAGDVVLCDRFHDSTRVYQFGGRAAQNGLMERLERAALAGIYPDLTIILDVPTAIGGERARRRRGDTSADRFEKDDQAIQESRRQAFLTIATAEPDRCVVVDGNRPVEDVAAEIRAIVDDRLDARRFEAIERSLTVGQS
ncbi:dTMP kinase [Jiella sp. MQZ9-1]|uniref:Thymidylate kinase n=1 Tax=Jiella flava TaxID=2816857 RepID=A0A939JSC6_9HYPH|nr:dTMP kinase [Jiella flava]MCD2471416.1 dTMP kinase [Jiella flava]